MNDNHVFHSVLFDFLMCCQHLSRDNRFNITNIHRLLHFLKFAGRMLFSSFGYIVIQKKKKKRKQHQIQNGYNKAALNQSINQSINRSMKI